MQYIIKETDISKSACTKRVIDNKVEYPFEPLGVVLQADVGKICKNVNGIWYVENQEQFKARLLKERITL